MICTMGCYDLLGMVNALMNIIFTKHIFIFFFFIYSLMTLQSDE